MTDQTEPTPILASYLSHAELAKQLNKSERTLDRWHALRMGPPRTLIGRDIYYRRDAVKRWLESPARVLPARAP